MFAVIVIPDFCLQATLRHQPELWQSPVALLDGTEAKSLILEITAAARAADVQIGMTPAQALARCSRILIQSRSNAQEQSAQAAMLQCAYSFSPYIESTASGVCTMSLKGLPVAAPFASQTRGIVPKEPASDEINKPPPASPGAALSERDGTSASAQTALHAWGSRLVQSLARLQLRAGVGIGATPLLAWHAAQRAEPVLVIEDAGAFLAGQPIEQIQPSAEILQLLRRWGIRTLGEFVALGKDRVTVRLGPEALELFERATGAQERPLKLAQPPQTFEESLEFPNEIESLEPLLFVLRRCLDQITQRLELAYLVAEEISLQLQLSSGENYQRLFKVPAPTRNVETLFRMLYTHLENLKTEAPIVSLQLSATPCHAEGYQLALFETPLRDPNHFSETVARLTALLGEDRVGTPALQPTHRPDDFRLERVRFSDLGERDREGGSPRNANPPETLGASSRIVAGLALRRFRPALQIRVETQNNKPSGFHGGKLKVRIARASGPWRSSGNWWEHAWKREEWDVETTTGRGYRIYQEADHWFLEGLFD